MSPSPVELVIGGHSYRVVASEEPEKLQQLAALVDDRLRSLGHSQHHPQALLLVALSLAHELEQERGRSDQLTGRSQRMLRSLLERVDNALENVDQNGEPLPEVTPATQD